MHQLPGCDLNLCTDCQPVTCFSREAKGDPDNQLSVDELSAKARQMLAEAGLDAAVADAFKSSIHGLADNRPMRDLRLFQRNHEAAKFRAEGVNV